MQHIEDIGDVHQDVESQTLKALKEFKRLKKLKSKRIGRGVKLFCPVCRIVNPGTQLTDEETITLDCGHLRELSLPAQSVGLVGIEEAVKGTQLAMEMFPYLPNLPTVHEQCMKHGSNPADTGRKPCSTNPLRKET